ncbi:MAG: PAS domain S-box protein [Desulfobacterales bacterium]
MLPHKNRQRRHCNLPLSGCAGTTARLSQSQKQYRNLFENTGTATILVEKNMRISMANSNFPELTGFSKKEITNIKQQVGLSSAKPLPDQTVSREAKRKKTAPAHGV